MSKTITLLVSMVILINVSGQINAGYKWTWLSGSSGYNASGTYGQKGVESNTNHPGGRFDFATWKDINGNLWLFGGFGRAASSTPGWLNDLWRFNPVTNRWTWMAGDSLINQLAYQSGLGVESPANTPSARSATSFWESGDGRELYLYGGATNIDGGADEIVGDLWAYNVVSGKWRILKYTFLNSQGFCAGQSLIAPACNTGPASDVFTPGVWPICRQAPMAAAAGNIAFVFGGQTGSNLNSEFFKFSDYQYNAGSAFCPSKNEWASIQFGEPYINGNVGYYSGSFPRPGARRDGSSFALNNGVEQKFYLFGGSGVGAPVNGIPSFGELGDLWRYDGKHPLTGQPIWTWLKGDSTSNGIGNFGSMGVANAANKPAARRRAPMKYAGDNQAILFGGVGRVSSGFGVLNDLWSYDAGVNIWTWIGGSSIPGHGGSYGTKGVQSNSNMIPAREGAGMWVVDGNVYIFGGCCDLKNDMWKFSPQQVPTPSNDEPCTAIPLVLDAAPVTGNNSFATTSAIDGPSTCFGYNNTVWYKYTPSTSGLVQFTLGGGPAGDTLNSSVSIFVPSGSCPGLSLSDSTNSLFGNCKTYSAFGQKSPSVWISHLTAGKTYYIRISGLFNDVGQYALSLQSTGGIVPPQPTITVAANREQTDPLGWTHYYHNNGTPATTDDDIKLVSILKNGNTIGSVGDGTFSLTVGLTAKAGTGRGEVINSPLISSASKFVSMNRYWNVTPTNQPTTPVTIRFYYHSQDLADINGDLAQQVPHFFLRPFKLTGGNPDPVTDWAGATKVTFYRNANSTAGNGWIYTALNTNTHMAEYTISSFSGGGIGGTNDLALPIQITSFTVTLADPQKVNLNWTTAIESNTKEFVVQRSVDAVQFEHIGTVKATGNSNDKKNYSYTDGLTLGSHPNILYYRLKTVDGDGTFSLSNVLSLRLNETKPFLFSLSPNPTQSYVRLLFANAAYFTIHDANGKLLLRRSVVDRTTETVDVYGYAKGSYMITVYGKNGKKETRWVQKQ